MKKLVIAAFAVAFAAAAQAASISWSINNIYGPETGALATKGAYTSLLFITENTTGVGSYAITTVDAVTTAIKAGDWTTVASLATVNKGLTTAGAAAGATGMATTFSSGSLSAFAVILDTTTGSDLATTTHYYLVNGGEAATVTFTSSSGTKVLGFGSQESNSKLAIGSSNAAWNVPEPTSGLLLLLGMAGLALKRKQA